MDYSHRFVVAAGLALATAACGGKQPAEVPPPVAEAPVYRTPPAPPRTPAPVDRRDLASDTRRATLEERIHFDLNRSDLTPAARAIMAAKADVLRSTPGLTLLIEGHADERGSDEYNLALSKRRAAEAKRFLVQHGIESGRLETVGHGEEQPLDPGSNEYAWSLNRRAAFRVTGGGLSQR